MIGRIGNQMFQIANAYAQSLRHNRQLVLPKNDTSVSDYYSSIHRKLDFNIDKSPTEGIHTINSTFHYTEYKPHDTLPTVFRGYYQSEKFFKDYSQSIKELFGPTESFVVEAIRDYPCLRDGSVTAINVRRGDYLTFPTRHPVVSIEYIHQAASYISGTRTYLVISDDIEWCKENIRLPNCVFSNYTREKALWLLSMCDNFIISNSTFSWWGAWLGQNSNKIVVAPSVWFGPDILRDTDPKDIYCEGWKIVPCEYSSNGIIKLT
jgi:hypothetical protein